MDLEKAFAVSFEAQRPRLEAVAYRMLGSFGEASDAVQEAWINASRADRTGVTNLGGWLTTVVSRVCLDLLRARTARRETSVGTALPDFVLAYDDPGAERALEQVDELGLALLVVLDTLEPAERLAFVLHDLFSIPFDDLASVLERSPGAARQLASRARRRIRREVPKPDPDAHAKRRAVEAFLDAARAGDFEGLLAVLDPDVVLRADGGAGALAVLRSAQRVAAQATTFAKAAASATPVRVNGAPAIVTWLPDGRPMSIMAFTVSGGRIVAIDALTDPARLGKLLGRRGG